MKNIYKTLIFTGILCLLTIGAAIYVQINGQDSIETGCSYLDHVTIDILAFVMALFLVIEGFARIFEHPSASLKRQLTRPIRIAIGCALITLHIMQFMHK